VVSFLGDEFGDLRSIEICLFPDRLPVDSVALGWPEGQTLRAFASASDDIVALSTLFFGQVREASIVGLVHIAQWRAGGESYPDFFARDVIGFYLSRDAGNTEQVHRAFVRANIGRREPWAPFPWSSGQIEELLLWNPEVGYGGAGDFAGFALAEAGQSVFVTPGAAVLADLDVRWREALFDESGSSRTGSRGWIAGLVALIAVLAAGAALAVLNRLSKTRAEAALREAAERAAEEAALAEQEREAVRTSIATSSRRRDARVRGGTPRTGGIDGDHGDRPPPGRPRGGGSDDVPAGAETDDDIFRHPSLREDD
jgi:hypothetical protein